MSTFKAIVIATVASLVAVLGAATAALAVDELNVAPGRTILGPGVAIHGYDPVAFFTEGAAVIGSAGFAVSHAGATYRFSSKEHQAKFEANPDKYVPAFGGFCAYGVSVGAKFDGDPRFWRVVDGTLYLNLNRSIQQTWLKDVPGNIKKAKKTWRNIESKDPESLS